MIGPPAITKNMPRGRPFQKGRSGNPRGRLKRTPEEVQLIEACREKTPEALEVITTLMHESDQDRVRLAAAQFVVERGYGKAPERIEILRHEEKGPLPGAELTPEQAYFQVIHRQYEVEEVEEVRQLPGPKTEPTCLGDILAEPVDSADESHSGKGSFGETEL